MGTRGIMGFRVNDKDYLTYNHFDSYPTGLGVNILKDLKLVNIQEFKKLAEAIKLVDENSTPTQEDIFELRKYTDMGVTENKDAEKPNWYQLLRDLQGELLLTLRAGYMIDSHEFIKDSLFCEWAYIVNFDENVLEVYEGFQDDKTKVKGRYKTTKPTDNQGKYYACSLIKTYALDNLPSEEDFIKDIEPEEDEECL